MVALLAISKSSSWNTWWESISSGIFGTWAANKNQTVNLRLILLYTWVQINSFIQHEELFLDSILSKKEIFKELIILKQTNKNN